VKLSWLLIGAPALSRQLSEECKAWMPWLVQRLVKRAVDRLPVDQRERSAEEWPIQANKIPGDIGKLVFAIGLWRVAMKASSRHSDRSMGGRSCY
jgi:hypothetical protein